MAADDIGTWGLFADGGPSLIAALANDSGISDTDHLTNDATITGQLVDQSQIVSFKGALDSRSTSRFIDLSGILEADGSFTIGQDLLAQMARGSLKDGTHTLYLTAKDDARHTLSTSVTFTLDSKAPTFAWLKLDASTDTGIKGDLATEDAFAKLQGYCQLGVTAHVVGHDDVSCVMNAGKLTIEHLELAMGRSSYTVVVADKAGNESSLTIQIERLDNTVIEWNHVALETIQSTGTAPPAATRALAMESLAVYDVVNLIQGNDTFFVDQAFGVPSKIDLQAAIATAAHGVLKTLYATDAGLYKGSSAVRTHLDDALADALGDVADGTAKTNGIRLGQQVAAAVIAKRAHDGWDAVIDPATEIGSEPGEWQPTPAAFANPLLPQWGMVTPFAVQTADQFMATSPTPLGSSAWADQYNETKALGAKTGSTRTADQTEIALFWADGGGTFTPPGHWNEIAAEVAASLGSNTADLAALYAMLNIALGDAAITCWNTKYTKDFWRPIAAIRNGAADGNPGTEADPTWTPLLATPPFPEYTSGHSTFSGAAAQVLTALYGDSVHFETGTSSTDPAIAGVVRSFDSFWDAAQEAGASRIYGGIHFQEANVDGLDSGRQIADWVLEVFGKR